MAKRLKRPEKNAGGFLPPNHFPYEGAYIFFRPGYGLVKIAFGNGMNGPDEEDMETKDRFGNEPDDYVYITYYTDKPEDDVWEQTFHPRGKPPMQKKVPGLLFAESDGFNMLFSRKSYPSGDLRDLLKEALKCIGWPIDVEKRYYLVGTDGRMNWDGRPTIGDKKGR